MIVTVPPSLYTCPHPEFTRVFMGGGIGECPDWQKEFIKEFEAVEPQGMVQLINPRWEYKWTGFQQIQWEYKMLLESDVIMMWFARGGQNRICFYELGMWINSRGITAVIGCDPKFDRKEDVAIQTHLARPELKIHTTLKDMALEVAYKIDNN
ncbi:hypothetical protein LCGC14_1081590 [marine sediment metagenome]|uniref:Nucleoside 2-deoxyribosyltransferase n=1 Tax=marine sediment metagenome TaxID=412755 RepID=A0A0F9QKY1_9ZZZZ